MNALRAAQWQYDNQLPPAVSDDGVAETEWIEKHAAELVLGYRVSWGFRSDRGEVAQADLARAVQDHLNQRQIDGLDVKDALGQLVMAGMGTGSSGVILGLCTYLLGGRDTLKKIASDLLRPHAAKAVAFEREQERLEQECGF